MPYNRREFLQTLAMASAAIPLSSYASHAPAWEIHCFTKPFQFPWMDFPMLCETFAAAGLNGVDYTVRPQGHILPENVTKDLPKAIAAVKKAGLSAKLMTTAILGADEKYTRQVLETAAGEGIEYYRMGWFDYEKGIPMLESLHNRTRQLKALTALNKELKIRGSYQNHSGLRIGSSIWDLYELVKDLDPAWTGVQYDIRHATVEGAAGWANGLRLIRPYINTIVIKDFKWKQNEKGKWVIKNTPLGEGMVDFKAYFKKVKEMNIHAPISLHLEYDLLTKAEESLSATQKQQIVLGKLKKDVATLRGYLAEL